MAHMKEYHKLRQISTKKMHRICWKTRNLSVEKAGRQRRGIVVWAGDLLHVVVVDAGSIVVAPVGQAIHEKGRANNGVCPAF